MSRGWLGVQIQEVTPAIAASLGLKVEHGALVAVVTPDSPGAQGGAQTGRRHPVVQRQRGEAIARSAAAGVPPRAPGSTASLTVWRNGQSSELHTTLGEAPENPRVASANGDQRGEQSGEQSGEDRADALGHALRGADQ